MTASNLYGKTTSINFTIKNISRQRKKINVFNYPLEYGQSRDLLNIPEITEDDIRSSLVKGELANKIRVGDIRIVSSTINLLQFDEEQKSFIDNALESPEAAPGIDPATIGGGKKNYNITIADSPFTVTNISDYNIFIENSDVSPDPDPDPDPVPVVPAKVVSTLSIILPDDPFPGQNVIIYGPFLDEKFKDEILYGDGISSIIIDKFYITITSNVKPINNLIAPITGILESNISSFIYDGNRWRTSMFKPIFIEDDDAVPA